jgi:hypothetical protein
MTIDRSIQISRCIVIHVPTQYDQSFNQARRSTIRGTLRLLIRRVYVNEYPNRLLRNAFQIQITPLLLSSGESFCGIATLVAAFDPDTAVISGRTSAPQMPSVLGMPYRGYTRTRPNTSFRAAVRQSLILASRSSTALINASLVRRLIGKPSDG